MNFHPILFSTTMVQAILEGRKTMTRRIIKPQPTSGESWQSVLANNPHDHNWRDAFTNSKIKCPYGQLGDILWVRETWAPFLRDTETEPGYQELIKFAADGAEFPFKHLKDFSEQGWHNRPSIHMPKAACRIFLKIKSIKVERLQNISVGDAVDEGIEFWNVDSDRFRGGELVADFKNYMWRDDEKYEDYFFPAYANAIDSFKSLWQKINGIESWQANPWLWVVEFERTEKPCNFC